VNGGPQLGLIRDDPAWRYPGYGGSVSARRLRIWRPVIGVIIAVLTERGADPGTSITNAAKEIILHLEREYPDELIRVIEHYPDNEPDRLRYSLVALDAHLRPYWRPLSATDACELLPGLEDDPSPTDH
jgi:hypothetical protein